MRSSTSSSDRVPADASFAAWLGALAVAAALVAAVELRVRASGWAPSRRDDTTTWSVERRRLAGGDPAEVALIGSSRAAFLDETALRDGLGATRVVNLTLDGASPLPVLEHLAADTSFRGIVVCDVVAMRWFDEAEGAATTAAFDASAPWRAPFEAAEQFPQDALAARHPRMTVARFLASGLGAAAPPAPATLRDGHRFERWNPAVAGDAVAKLRTEFLRAAETAPPAPTGPVADDAFARLREAVDRLVVRGAQVVLLRLPVTGARRDAEERRFPRALVWDRLAATPGVVVLDCLDDPELARAELPDDSHLANAASPGFTAALAAAIRQLPRR